MKKILISQTIEETQQIGQALASCLQPMDFIALIGDLGSGKTTLTQGICEGLRVRGYVNSPTYTIINIYEGRLPVYHFDLFRLGDISELEELGYEEYFWGDGVTLIEWADRGVAYFPDCWIEIKLKALSATVREISIETRNVDSDDRFQPFLDVVDANFST